MTKTPEQIMDADERLLNQTAGTTVLQWLWQGALWEPLARCSPPMSTGMDATRISVSTVGSVRICKQVFSVNDKEICGPTVDSLH